MNKGIAKMLMLQLATLDYIQRFGGLAMVATESETIVDEGVTKLLQYKHPVVTDYIDGGPDVPTHGLLSMAPNSNLTGLLFFEDGGSRVTGQRRGNSKEWESKLRLIVWLNTEALNTSNITTILHAQIAAIFNAIENQNFSPYSRVRVSEVSVLPQDEKIFSKYTFDLVNNQYLLPPFEYYAVDYSVKYYFNPLCVDFDVIPLSPHVHYPTLSEIFRQMSPRTIDLIVGTDIETGTVVHILREHGLGDADEPIALSEVYVLGIVLMNSPVQGWKINTDDAEALDFEDTGTGGIFTGTITITFRKKSIDV